MIRKQATTTKIFIPLLLLILALVFSCGVVSAADNNTNTTVNSVQKLAPVEISGMVKKCSDGTAFQGAKVTVKDNGKLISNTTKADGTYILNFQSMSRIFNVTASANGHKPSTQTVTANKNTQGKYTGKANFQLGANDAYVWNGWATTPNQDITFSDGTTIHYTGTTNAFTTISNAITWITAGNTVYIAPATYKEHGITIDKSINIQGENQATTIINAEQADRIFYINYGLNVNIQQLTLTQGKTGRNGHGGAILNYGNLIVENCTFTDNNADLWGGAIMNYIPGLSSNTLTSTITNCTFTGNSALIGGAITNQRDGTGSLTSTITNCTFTGNSAQFWAGAIENWGGDTTVTGCTLTGNSANIGGAIYNSGGTGTNPTLTAQFNRIIGNTMPDVDSELGTANANNNWWGSNFEGTTPLAANRINGGVSADHWVILTVKANPNTINNGATSIIAADFNHINGGGILTGGNIPEEPITLNIPWGSFTNPAISHSITKDTINGLITATFYANQGTPPLSPLKVTATADGYTTTDTESAYVTVNKAAVLSITKTGPTTVNAGDTLTYTITITNNGPDLDATSVTLQDVMTNTSDFNTGTLQYRYQTNGGAWSAWTSFSSPLNLNLGTINNGNTAIIEIRGTVKLSANTGTHITNTATTDTTTTPGPKTATITTTINGLTDVDLTKTVDKSKPNVGETITFTVTTHNQGPSDATNLQIQDVMPFNFTDVIITPSKGTYNNGIWTLDLTSRETATLTLTGKVTATQAGKNTTNTATIQGTTKTASISIYVPKSDLYVKITSNKNNLHVGEKFTLTYKLGNNGPDPAENVTITTPLPSGFELANISGDGTWTYNTATKTITWTLKNVPVGDPYLYIIGSVNQPGTYVFTSSIKSNTYTINTQGTPITINAVNKTNEVNAASQTIRMQKTGAPLFPLALAILSILGGVISTRKKQ
jgi:uncharacterized repeat protein (TIGR01451 family)